MITSTLDAPGPERARQPVPRARHAWQALLSRRALLIALPSIAALLALVCLLRASAAGFPVGDHAVLELYVLHARRGWWMLGAYSQYGWNHPGPLLFYLMEPLYIASGEKTLSMAATAWLLNTGCGLLIVWIVLRHAPVRARVWMLAVLGIYALRIQPLFTSVWNPHVLLWPLLALPFFTALAAAGYASALVPVVILASFLAQTHVGLVPIAAVLGAVAFAMAIVSARSASIKASDAGPHPHPPPSHPLDSPSHPHPHPRSHSHTWRWIAGSACLLALLWLLPLVEQLTATPHGNLTKLYEFFITNPSPRVGWLHAAPIWANFVNGFALASLRLPAGVPVARNTNIVSIAAALLQCALLAAAALRYHRRGARTMSSFCLVGLISALTAWWAIAQIRGELFDHAVFWTSAIGAVNWSLAAAFASEWLPSEWLPSAFDNRAAARAAIAFGIGGLLYVAAPSLIGIARAATAPDLTATSRVKMVADGLQRRIDPASGQKAFILIEQSAWEHAAGVILQLYKRRVPIAIDPAWISMFGQPLAPAGTSPQTVVFIPRNSDPAPRDIIVGCTPVTCAVLR